VGIIEKTTHLSQTDIILTIPMEAYMMSENKFTYPSSLTEAKDKYLLIAWLHM